MPDFCHACGKKILGEFKFCPDCGVELNVKLFQSKTEPEIETIIDEVIVCENCGEENQLAAKICAGCGAKLSGKVVKSKIQQVKLPEPTTEKIVAEPVQQKQNSHQHKYRQVKTKSGKPEQKVPIKKQSKELDSKKIIITILGSVLVITIIMFLTGKINFSESEDKVQNDPVQNSSPVVDLNNVQKINELESQVNAAPNNLTLLLQLAHLKNDSGFYEKAIIDYNRYLEANSSDADARIDMGVCYYNLANYTKAIEEMEKALTYQPTHQIGHLNLGVVNMAANNIEKAKQWLEKAVKLNPNTDAGKRAQELLNSH